MKKISWRHLLALSWFFVLIVGIIFVSFRYADGAPMGEQIFAQPSKDFWLGTDSLGRDLVVRIFLGAKSTLIIGLGGVLLASLLAYTLGMIAGWRKGLFDSIFMRATDLLLALPSVLLAALIIYSFMFWVPSSSGVGVYLALILALGFSHWMTMARVLRAQVLEVQNEGFVEASRALGASSSYILLKHITPHILRKWLGFVVMQIPLFLMYEGFLSFIGLGLHAPDTSWGLLIKEGWKYLSSYPHLVLAPSSFLFLTVFALHLGLESRFSTPES